MTFYLFGVRRHVCYLTISEPENSDPDFFYVMIMYISLPVHYIMTYTALTQSLFLSTHHIPGLDYFKKQFLEQPVYNKKIKLVSFYQSSNQMCM